MTKQGPIILPQTDLNSLLLCSYACLQLPGVWPDAWNDHRRGGFHPVLPLHGNYCLLHEDKSTHFDDNLKQGRANLEVKTRAPWEPQRLALPMSNARASITFSTIVQPLEHPKWRNDTTCRIMVWVKKKSFVMLPWVLPTHSDNKNLLDQPLAYIWQYQN